MGSSSINLIEHYQNNNTARLASAVNPINGIATNSTLNVPFPVPYLGYQAVGVRGTAFDAYANYNSLQVTVRKQLSHGFTFQGAYTWSRDMTVEYNDVANSNNAADLGQQYGPAAFSRPQRFVANYSYDLPFGARSGFLEKLVGGWNASGVTVIQGGSTMNIADQTAGTCSEPAVQARLGSDAFKWHLA